MTPDQLIAQLRTRGVLLWADGNTLKISAPRGALTEEDRAQLQGRKAELLAALDGIPPVPRGGDLPLSPAQERLWLVQALDPESTTFHRAARARIEGELDPERLRRAFGEVVARHEALRATFHDRDGAARQRVGPPPAAVPLPFEDLRPLPAGGREERIAAAERADSAARFDLSSGPLFRLRLFRTGDREHVLLLVTHHIAVDGLSTSVVMRELSSIYASGSAGAPVPRVQYADWAAWQRARLDSGALEGSARFWREELAGSPPALELPTDRPRTPAAHAPAGRCPFALDRDASARLRALARQEGATPFMAALAAFQCLLSRYSGQRVVVVGTAVTGRSRPELEELVGLFVNLLPLRGDLSGNPSFLEALRRARDAAVRALAHQELPFERIVRGDRAAAFQAMLVLTPPLSPLEAGGLVWTPADSGAPQTDLDLVLALEDRPENLAGTLEYRADLFDAGTAERMSAHLAELIGGALAEPERRLSDLPLLTPPEREGLVERGRGEEAPYPRERCLHQLFEEQAARTPGQPAVIAGDRTLTYRELDALAGRIAAALAARGAGPESLVAVAMAPSAEQIAALLGVLKAGAAYLPLDLAAPADRRAFILRDAGVRVALCDAGQRAELEARGVVALVPEALGEPPPAPGRPAPRHPGQLCYAIYTSGSTGEPKGVLVEHRAVVNHSVAVARHFELAPGDRMLNFTPVHFDAAVEEIYPPLLRGAAVVVLGDLVPPADFRGLIQRHRAGVLSLPPAYLHEWLLELERAGEPVPDCVRLVILGGEQIRPETAALWLKLGGGKIPWNNVYGPTEATVTATLHPIRWSEGGGIQGTIPIGRPIANKRVFVVDGDLNLAPPGVPGELCIGGVGLARGYLGRPALTAEKFVPSPFHPGERLYRTGDLARWREDGALEFLGRIDLQVKIRGVRVELGEVEAALDRLPGVRQSAVVAVERTPGDRALAAYLVTGGDRPPASELRRLLLEKLPAPMVPAAFAFLDRLPLTANGKIDRRALPPPSWGPEAAGPSAPPRTPLEEAVAKVWGQVLGTDRVGREDDFFALGGHSLLAAQAAARLKEAVGRDVPLRLLFDAPTVAGLAERLQRLAEPPELPELPEVRRLEGDGPAPLSFPQQRLWFLHQLQPDSAAYTLSDSLDLEGPLDVPALEAALAALVERHEVLRTTVGTEDGQPAQRVSPPAPAALERIDLSGLGEAERRERLAALVLEEAGRVFDLERGPLFVARLARLGERHHRLFLSMHHLVSDGWSMGVLVRDLLALYQGQPLAALPVRYRDFAAWQRAVLDGPRTAAELAHWEQALRGAPPLLDLPSDRPRPKAQSFRGGRVKVELPEGTFQALRRAGQERSCTPFMTLLAGYGAFLAKVTRQTDLVVGTPIAGRARPELEPLVGIFVNLVPLRLDASADPTFEELLGRVRDRAVEAQAHQVLPFEQLVDHLQVHRSLGHTPIFQVAIQSWNAPVADAHAGALRARFVESPRTMVPFDLMLSLVEREGGVDVFLDYSADLFERATAEALGRRLALLLKAAGERPAARLSDLPLMDAAEAEAMVRRGEARGPFPDQATLPELFAEQVARAPGAPAVEYGGRRMTYRELDAASAAVAARLRERGIGRGAVVGLRVGRSAEAVAGMLGIVRAGAAYLPLDPSYPAERLALLAEDAGAVATLTPEDLAGPPPGGAAPSPGVGPLDLAYVMYTSGSTGRPKGIGIPHRAIVRLVKETNYVQLGPGDRVAQLSVISFDAATFEIWGALLNGGTVVGVERGVSLSPDELAEALRAERITAMFITAALFQQVARQRPDAFATVRTVLAGGDAVDPDAARTVLEKGPPGRLLNGYGPTETTTFAGWHHIRAVEPGAATVPIGGPLANTGLYVLDPSLRPVPPGVPGELYIGGPGLARGYVGRPDLTAARFVPHPFARDPGERLYRTGDVARWNRDGAIEVLGRADFQVKVRGFRVEPQEIEAALLKLPGVQEAVVVARALPTGEKRLLGYVAPAPGAALEPRGLREGLRRTLPEYLVPSVLMVLDRLPLNPNGKLDRAALPDPGQAEGPESYAEPRTPDEQALAAIWASVLALERVGLHDNFFELGGDSILSIQLVSRAREAGLALRARDVFEHQTVAELAAAARRPGALAEQGPVVGEVPLSPAQRWFFDRWPEGPSRWNMVAVLEPARRLEEAPLRRALEAVLRQHDVLRARFDRQGGRWRQTLAPPGEPAPLEALAAADVTAAADRLQSGLDLQRGPLLRLGLVDLEGGRGQRLVIAAHHLVLDAVSARIVLEDLARAYEGAAPGPKTTSFKAWTERPAPPAPPPAAAPPLPRDFPGGANLEREARSVERTLDEARTAALLRAAQAAYRTQPHEPLLAALAVALARWSGNGRVLVDLEGHGRDEAEGAFDLSRTVGWFTDISARLLEPPAGPPRAALMAIKEQARAARSGSAEVSFNYLGRLDQGLSAGGLFRPAPESPGHHRALDARRPYLFEVSARVTGAGRLSIAWDYAASVHRAETVEALAGAMVKELEALAEHLRGPDAAGVTPSDFPLAELPQDALERVVGAAAREVEDLYPLSPMQQGMVFHSLLSPGSGEYLGQMVCTLGGALDPDAFRQAWQAAVDRHAILRTAFLWEGLDRPLQLVRRTAELPFAVEDWRGLDAAAQKERLDRLVAADVQEGFRLERPPLMRVRLLRTRDDAHVLLWSYHHVLLDGWCLAILFQEVMDGYAAARAGTPLRAPPARPFRDYIAFLRRQDAAADEAYWRGRLGDFREPTPLAFAAGDGEGGHAEAEISLSREASDALRAFARARRLTLSTLVQAAWAVVLSRYAGTDDVVFGATLSGRPAELEGVERMMGLFINTLPVRIQVDGRRPVLEWLSELQSAQLLLREHEWSALPDVHGLSGVPRDRALFESIVVFENYPSSGRLEQMVEAAGLHVSGTQVAERANFPFGLISSPAERVPLRAHYHAGVVDAATVDRVLRELAVVLQALAGAGERATLSELPLLHEEERRAILEEWPRREGATVLDRERRPCPIWAVGEKHLRGEGGALTPTGRLARWSPDGALEDLGRADRQGLVRGARIDLERVEAALRRHPAVADAGLAVLQEPEGESLCAAVATAAQPPPLDELRELLAAALPRSVPAPEILPVPAVPRAADGRPDLSALLQARRAPRAKTPPSSPQEQALLEIWREVLGVKDLGVEDSFFELGGHSLLVPPLLSRMREAFGVELPMRAVFDAPTLAAQARAVEDALIEQIDQMSDEEAARLLARE